MAGYEIRLAYAETDAEPLNDLFNEVFVCPRSLEMFHWKYEQASSLGMPIGVGAFADGIAIGFYGSLPWVLVDISDPNTPLFVRVSQPCDVGIRVEWRGTGLYEELFAFYDKQSALLGSLAFGFPSPQALAIGQAKMGYVRKADTMILTRSGEDAISRDSEYGVYVESELPSDWFPWFSRVTAKRGITTFRSWDFMRWRFRSVHPKKYKFISARKGGVVVGAAVMMHAEWQQGRIYDVCADNPAALRAVLSVCVEEARGFSLLYGSTAQSEIVAQLKNDFGFVTSAAGALVSTRLHDADGNTPVDSASERLFASDRWDCSLTDTDM